MDDRELLLRYAPRLRYDSQENYFADSAAIWTDSPTNVLKRHGDDGELIAIATPGKAQQRLSLDFLRAGTYPDPGDSDVRDDDCISHPEPIDVKDYQPLHESPKYRNRMYGHIAQKGNGPRWLQYWFFYFYNDAPFKLVQYGKHEGDWEMIQLQLGKDGRPVLAAYAQHKFAEIRKWRDVEKTAGGETPVVYPARGSHASYFDRGPHHFHTDRANGEREAPPLVLEVLHDSDPPWVTWPGVWGDTHAEIGEDSPRGPSTHGQWADPDGLVEAATKERATPARLSAPPPRPLEVEVARRDGGKGEIAYALPSGATGTARHLLVTVNSPDDHRPPTTRAISLTGGSGTVSLDEPLDDEKRYEIKVSTATDDGVLSGAVTRWVRPAKT
jgi:hypothetical protein